MKEEVYLEDILKRKNFTFDEIKNAKHKYPVLCWLKAKKFWFKDSISNKLHKIKRKIERLKNDLL